MGTSQRPHVSLDMGAFEFLVMPFRLTNVLATFCTLINQVFHEYLDKFVVMYLDDIMVYSATMEEHKEHLAKMFQKLRENQLYVKRKKMLICTRKH